MRGGAAQQQITTLCIVPFGGGALVPMMPLVTDDGQQGSDGDGNDDGAG